MKTIVFDFDKTLTYKDTMNQFFFWRMRGIRAIYWPAFLFLVILVKIKLLSIKRLKELSIRMLAPKKKDEMMALFKKFSKEIVVADTIKILNKRIKEDNRVIVLSASPVYYLQEIFNNKVEIIGTTFEFDSNMTFKGIAQHPYGKDKYNALIDNGINSIYEMYYDSKSDEVLFPLCKFAYKVKNGLIIRTTQL